MKLHSPEIETRMRVAVRGVIRTSRSLRNEAKRLRRSGVTNRFRWLWFVVPSGFLVRLMGAGAEHQAGAGCSLSVLAIWGLVTVLIQSAILESHLYQGDSVKPLLLLPVEDDVILRWQAQSFLARSIAVWMVSAAGFTYLATLARLPYSGWWVVPVLASGQWMLILALAALLLAYPFAALRVLLLLIPVSGIGGFLLLVDKKFVGPQIALLLDTWSPWITLVFPTGWMPALFRRGVIGHDWMAFSLFAPLSALVWMGLRTLPQLRRNFIKIVAAERAYPQGSESEDEITPSDQAPVCGPTETIDSIHARGFLQPASSESQGLLERAVFSRITRREQLLLECVSAESIRWSSRWRLAASFLVIGMLGSWFFQKLGVSWFGWIDGITLLIAAGLSLSTGVRIDSKLPVLFPATVGEMVRLKMKIATVRSLSALPLLAMYGALLAWRLGGSASAGASSGAKVVVLLFAIVPALSMTSVSSGTTDTSKMSLRSLWMILMFLGCAVTILGFGAASLLADFSAEALWIGWVCVVPYSVTSWAFSAYYQRQFNRCWFDVRQQE